MAETELQALPETPRQQTQRILSTTERSTFDVAAPSSSCWSWLRPSPPRQRAPFAVGPGSSTWVEGEGLTHCSICEVEFGVQHKHVTKRHCRKCGGVFCYTCTYDKAQLRTWGSGLCLPLGSSKASVHVCSNCYDSCPPPSDGLRRCRFCHQRVRRLSRLVPSPRVLYPLASSSSSSCDDPLPGSHRAPLPNRLSGARVLL